ncbi:MAG TPA: hypothetical protein VJR50_09820 [Mycobacterium sp.]|nr:hypothetical protein [Mycobacterium sp.]
MGQRRVGGIHERVAVDDATPTSSSGLDVAPFFDEMFLGRADVATTLGDA